MVGQPALRSHSMRKHLSVAAAIACAAVIAACSSSTQGSPSTGSSAPSSRSSTSVSDLKTSVLHAMQAATSFHMVGNAMDDSGKPIQFDIHFGEHQVAGSIVQEGQKIELINPGGQWVYFRAPDSLWQQQGGAAAVALFHGKWVKVAADDQRFTSLTGSFDKDAFVNEMMSNSGSSSDSDLRKVGPATVNGAAATKYRSDSDHTELYLAANGAPVILKIVDPSSDGGSLTFSEYGKANSVTPPPDSQTVDFAKLEGGH
jgi:hypothetical protein